MTLVQGGPKVLPSPAISKLKMAVAPLTLQRDITRAVELLENLQKSGEVDTAKVEALKKVCD